MKELVWKVKHSKVIVDSSSSFPPPSLSFPSNVQQQPQTYPQKPGEPSSLFPSPLYTLSLYPPPPTASSFSLSRDDGLLLVVLDVGLLLLGKESSNPTTPRPKSDSISFSTRNPRDSECDHDRCRDWNVSREGERAKRMKARRSGLFRP